MADASTLPVQRAEAARELLLQHAERTGVEGADDRAARYLWTDAFAVMTLLEVGRRLDDPRCLELARRLVDQVHRVLGRFRADGPRRGWLSGLDDDAGEAHPTAGGLRIGKPLPERDADEPFEERREWDRDGQYFHYLTKWMQALARCAAATGDVRFAHWAVELGLAARRGFVRTLPGRALPGVVWKMSCDLSRPLVPATGRHDALDGWLTLRELEGSAPSDLAPEQREELRDAAAELRGLCAGSTWDSGDPLGIGGLLVDALRASRLLPEPERRTLAAELLVAAERGLVDWARRGDLELPVEARLAFRELGLAIGLHALPYLAEGLGVHGGGELASTLRRLVRFAPLAPHLEATWVDPRSRSGASWLEHRDIDDVMLAATLAPEGYLAVDQG